MTSRQIESRLPGLRLARMYRSEWLRSDLVAGLTVAAVALPIGIAYSQLAGFPQVVGIYSCILPAVAYALFGSSRQLIVNPDSAACAIVAATLAPLAAGDASRYADLSIALTFLTGLLCISWGGAGVSRGARAPRRRRKIGAEHIFATVRGGARAFLKGKEGIAGAKSNGRVNQGNL